MYYTYILYSSSRNLHYVGYTSNLKRRLHYHKTGQVNTTKSFGKIELVWYAAFKTKEQALSFEKYLKSSSGFAFRNKRLL